MNTMTTRRKIIIGGLAAFVAVGIIGAIADTGEEEVSAPLVPVVAETTEVPVVETTEVPVEATVAPVVTAAPVTAPPVTAVEFDEFEEWFVGQLSTVLDLGADMVGIAPLIDSGDIAGASRLSTEIGDTFGELYFDAPETGTELSDVANDMLLTCSVAYTVAGIALDELDMAEIDEATVAIGECTRLMNDTTELIPG